MSDEMGGLFDSLFGQQTRSTWFQLKIQHDEFIVNRDRVGGIRRYHIPGNLHTISILWTNGDSLVIYSGMSDDDAERTWQRLRTALGVGDEQHPA